MPLEHTLIDMDSLPSLALKYLGDATRANEIADYNKLSYPYIVQDKLTLLDYFGSGYVTATRANYTGAALLKKGWTFKTKPNVLSGGSIKTFEVIEDVHIPAGIQLFYIPLRCVVPGGFGNVVEYTITEVGDDTALLSGIQFLSVYNEDKFSGGRSLDVLTTGDTIFIPTRSSEVIPENAERMLELTGGEDLVLDTSGDIVIEVSGDLASVFGADNIRYAVSTRLMTELGDLLQHPEYGTAFQDLIGHPNLASRDKLIEIAIYRSLAQEDRITEVTVDSLSVSGTSISVKISYKIAMSGMLSGVSLVV